MLSKNSMIRGMILSAALAFPAASALADWNVGDAYKMHWPQLPDPAGWDVNFTYSKVLADDFKCTETGPITDVHFWLSSRFDLGTPDLINNIHVSILSDVPATAQTKSHPGQLLWSDNFSPNEFRVVQWNGGLQGWYDPSLAIDPSPYEAQNHLKMWQVNITDILNPYKQTEGTIYWLALSVDTAAGTNAQFGWKSSLSEHFNDDAVWGVYNPTGGTDPFGDPASWNELVYPDGRSMDLSFVITPEPGSMLMFAAGGVMLMLRRRR